MARAKSAAKKRPAMIGAFVSRPKVLWAIAAGLAVGLGLALATPLDGGTSTVLGWDASALVFGVWGLIHMRDGAPEKMRTRAAADDEGRAVILVLVMLAAAFSLGAVAGELSKAKAASGLVQALFVVLAAGTVAASWFVAQLAFAIHYAHGYYDRKPQGGRGDAEGLLFPGGTAPDYWDFLHFAVIIGVACQTADVQITSKPMRRLSTTHSLFAFAFNTVIVALTINLVASLLQ